MQHDVAKLPWTTITTIMDKIKDDSERIWYVEKTLENLWSRTILEHQIATNLYNRQALPDNKISNYKETLPTELGKKALEMLNKADMQIDKDGNDVGYAKKLEDIKNRYGENSTTYKNAETLIYKLRSED